MFHVFVGDDYYPCSGLGDYEGSFKTEEKAIEYGKKRISDCFGWMSVITEKDGKLVEVYEANSEDFNKNKKPPRR